MLAAFDPQTFAPWTGKHAAVIAAMAAIGAAMIWFGRRVDPARRRELDAPLAWAAFAVWAIGTLRDAWDANGSLRDGLPLHWCDVTGAIACVALAAPQWRLPRTLLHFWGLCICSLAFALPVIGKGPAYVDFWQYFATHAAIVLAALYDRGVRDYRPNRYDALTAIGVGLAFALALQPVNLALGANYGYVGRSAFGITQAIDRLMPWPGRIGVLLAIECFAFAALLAMGKAIVRIRREQRRRLVRGDVAPTPIRVRPATPLVARRAA